MATTVRYTAVDGEVLAEKRGGSRYAYVPDPLGSVVAKLDNTQTKTDTYEYWPYGEVASRTGTSVSPYQFVGTLGYYSDSSNLTYVRARYFHHAGLGQFMSRAPIIEQLAREHPYGYAVHNPMSVTDPSGNDSSEWIPWWLDPNNGTGSVLLDWLSEALKNHPSCLQKGGGFDKVYAMSRCIMGCENRDEPCRTNPWIPDKHHTRDTGGIGPFRVFGKPWPELQKRYPEWWFNPYQNILMGVAILCESGKPNPNWWDTYKQRGERAACYDKCMNQLNPKNK
jgi:RHS repeat-associated protein